MWNYWLVSYLLPGRWHRVCVCAGSQLPSLCHNDLSSLHSKAVSAGSVCTNEECKAFLNLLMHPAADYEWWFARLNIDMLHTSWWNAWWGFAVVNQMGMCQSPLQLRMGWSSGAAEWRSLLDFLIVLYAFTERFSSWIVFSCPVSQVLCSWILKCSHPSNWLSQKSIFTRETPTAFQLKVMSRWWIVIIKHWYSYFKQCPKLSRIQSRIQS